jgi:phage/plasmid-associated DNA primase
LFGLFVLFGRERLNPPLAVLDATAEYLEAEDSTAAWIDGCELDPNSWETSAALFASWKSWAELNGEFTGNRKVFSKKLESRGLQPKKNSYKGGRGYQGISLALKPALGGEIRQWTKNRDVRSTTFHLSVVCVCV